jgi:hypothetical protein
MQGLSVGWGDIYANNLFGQSIELTGLPNGYYKLFIEVDPKNQIFETNETDNLSCTLLYVDVINSNVTVDPAGCGSM